MQTQAWAIIRLKTIQGLLDLFLVLVLVISLNLSFEAQYFLHVLYHSFIHINTEVAVHSAPYIPSDAIRRSEALPVSCSS
jgi:hypothetical protein